MVRDALNNEPLPLWDEDCWQQPAQEADEAAYEEGKKMTWTMKADQGGDFQQPPTGPQAAVLTRIIDIGTHTDTSPQFGVQRRHQMIMMWELAELMTDGRPFTIQKFYTLSMNEKANLRKDLEAWRGKAFEPHEEVALDRPLGASCMLSITETDRGKSKVAAIMALPKGMPKLEPVGPLLVFRTDEPDWSVYEQLSEFHQRKIAESEEWTRMKGGPAAAAAAEPAPNLPTGVPESDLDDPIPFSNYQLRAGYVVC